jgi:putative ABC transport system permease protein
MLRALWANLVRRADVETDLDDELRAYLDALSAEYERSGLDPVAARRAARLELGGVDTVKEATRDVWAGNALAGASRELRQTIRSLRRAPVYVVAVVATLGLAIGAATALYTIVKGSLLRPLPAVAEPERLVSIEPMRGSMPLYDVSYPDYQDLRAGSPSLASVAAYDGTSMVYRAGNATGRAWVSWVTGDFFTVLGVHPAAGRLLSPSDAAPGTTSLAVVISHAFWQAHFDGSRDVIGTRLTLDGYPLTIVGVAPPGFVGAMSLHGMEMWIPLTMMGAVSHFTLPLDSRAETVGRLVGRLAPGRTVEDARRELTVVAARLAATYPEDRGKTVAVYAGAGMTLEEREDASRLPRLLAGAVALLLLIACANVATLSLVRTASRRRELATRLALGASRRSLVARLAVESALLGGVAAVLGVALAWSLVRWGAVVQMIVSMDGMDLTLDRRVLALAILISVGATVLVGIAPSFETWRASAIAVLKDGAGAARRRSRAQRGLVVAQVAASLVLVASAAFVVAAVRRTLRSESGIDARGVVTTFLTPHDAGLDAAGVRGFYRDVLARVASDPAVDKAAIASTVPPARWAQPGRVFRRGDEPPIGAPLDQASALRAYVDDVSPGFFDALGIPILVGRDFERGDDAGAAPVAIVSRSLAQALWPNENPIGKLVVRVRTADKVRRALRVVGVAADIRYAGMAAESGPAMYVPYTQGTGELGNLTLIARGRGSRALSDSTLRRIAGEVAPAVSIRSVDLLAAQISGEFAPHRRVSGWLAAFGGIALLLAALGLYGVIAQDVLHRTRELAVRAAIGASPLDLVGLVLRGGVWLTGLGTLVGSLGAIAVVRVLRSMFTGLGYLDPRALAGSIALLVLVSALAVLVPALRIVRLDAARALRAD